MDSEYRRVEKEVFGRRFELETGRIAKQADGSVLARYGETVVLATIVASKERSEGEDFLPLTVNYQEKTYAAGKIPGGYFKREGRPTEKEVLTSRLIDRPIRPLLPDNFIYTTQIMLTVLSADIENDPDVLSVTAASAAIMVSNVPFAGPLAAVRVGRVGGELICNPIREQLEDSDMNIVVAGTAESIVMVEGSASEVPEDEMVEALIFAQESLQEFIKPQLELVSGLDIQKREVPLPEEDPAFVEDVNRLSREGIKETLAIASKVKRSERMKEIYDAVKEELSEKYPEQEQRISAVFERTKKEVLRDHIVNAKLRPDGRDYTTVRLITGEVGFLPRTHGSALFTRGETQSVVVATLGTSYDEQRIDALEGDIKKSFMLHYNFPPFSVGETSYRLAPGRREIGHGYLAERSIKQVLPSKEEFPYTIRVVSDILESNGSSSMATVCGASMALMDAGVPIKAPVGGIAMGLIKDGDDFVILSDILGDEDHLGDMDFKVAGTRQGVTGLQMDIKVTGVTKEILSRALEQAYHARLHVLDKMEEVIGKPRDDISDYAPKIITFRIKQEKIKDVIGPGGRIIKNIVEQTGVHIDLEDDGTVHIASVSKASCDAAQAMVEELIKEAEQGKVYLGVVKRVLDFGAIVELFNGTDGLVHISELDNKRVKEVSDILKEGDEVLVKCLRIERDGKIRLSRKEALGENIEDYRPSTS
ncbi:MAG: polyribonucleotide nucleotidyltransferase [Candidatus Dadabacteria bacterium]|nr:polyribonucleotide nucleotidyltransferase [Candidatus Dadabacteria bacterium]